MLDIGVFTGASSLAAALALPEDGIVVGCDASFYSLLLLLLLLLIVTYFKRQVSEDFTARAQKYWKEAGVENKVHSHFIHIVAHKTSIMKIRKVRVIFINWQVHLKIAPATETLQKLVDNNEAGTFDFAFIDADKVIHTDQNGDNDNQGGLTMIMTGPP